MKGQLIEELAALRKARVEEILEDFSRDRLKELCRAFDLDDSGREKAVLVARLDWPVDPVAGQHTGPV